VASFLHSILEDGYGIKVKSSHLFQRVASFLLTGIDEKEVEEIEVVLISFREWLHSYS